MASFSSLKDSLSLSHFPSLFYPESAKIDTPLFLLEMASCYERYDRRGVAFLLLRYYRDLYSINAAFFNGSAGKSTFPSSKYERLTGDIRL